MGTLLRWAVRRGLRPGGLTPRREAHRAVLHEREEAVLEGHAVAHQQRDLREAESRTKRQACVQ